MGTIIGSIYPLDEIVFEEGGYRNSVNPAQAAAAEANPAQAAAKANPAQAAAGVLSGANSAVLSKYGVMPPKPLDSMTQAELRRYKKVLESAVKAATSESDKNVLNLQISQVKSRIKEEVQGVFEKIWDGMVTLSGVQPKDNLEQTTKQDIDYNDDGEDKRKRKNKNILIGVGIGVGVLLIGTITYLAFRKK